MEIKRRFISCLSRKQIETKSSPMKIKNELHLPFPNKIAKTMNHRHKCRPCIPTLSLTWRKRGKVFLVVAWLATSATLTVQLRKRQKVDPIWRKISKDAWACPLRMTNNSSRETIRQAWATTYNNKKESKLSCNSIKQQAARRCMQRTHHPLPNSLSLVAWGRAWMVAVTCSTIILTISWVSSTIWAAALSHRITLSSTIHQPDLCRAKLVITSTMAQSLRWRLCLQIASKA